MKENIRILSFSPIYYPHVGGAERTIYELFTRLANKKYIIDLVTPNYGGKKIEIHDGFTTFRVGKELKNRYLKFIFYQYEIYKKAINLIKKNKYDFIQIHFGFPTSLIALYLSKKFKIPLITSEYHLGTGMDIIKAEQNPFFVNPILKKVYNASSLILTISNEQKKFIHSVSGRNDSIVIFQGTDHEYFSPKNYDATILKKFDCKSFVFITVSRLSPRKNILDMIRAVKIVTQKFKHIKLLIVGKGEDAEKIKKLIHELNLENNVILTGFISDNKLKKLYATADLFLLTSKYEGFGIANCEALASGTPIITYDTTAALDYIEQGKTGFVTKHSVKEFSEKILYLLNNPKKLKEFSLNARKTIEKNYTWQIYANKHDKIIKNYLSMSKRGKNEKRIKIHKKI